MSDSETELDVEVQGPDVNETYSTKTYQVYGEPVSYEYEDVELRYVLTFGALRYNKWANDDFLAPADHAQYSTEGLVRVLTHTRKIKKPNKSRSQWTKVLTTSL